MVTRNRAPRPDKGRAPNQPAGAAAGPAAAGPDAAPWAAIRTAFGAFGRRLPEMRDDLSWYAAAQADRARLALATAGTRVAAGVLQVVVIGAVFATAASLVLVGAAGGVAAALDGNVWLANLVTGLTALAALFAVLALRHRVLARRRLLRLMQRYEPRRDAKQRAAGPNGAQPVQNHANRS